MKAVLMSIQPKWVEKIASGEKTIEVRKSRPTLKTPFKVYIYMTAGCASYPVEINGYPYICNNNGGMAVIGEFVCDRIDRIGRRGVNDNFDYCYLSLNEWGNDDIEIEITDIKKSCIPKRELNSYGANTTCLYAWHITDLKIYDKQKALSEFRTFTNCGSVIAKDMLCNTCCICSEFCVKKTKRIKRPPQSWCYVEQEK